MRPVVLAKSPKQVSKPHHFQLPKAASHRHVPSPASARTWHETDLSSSRRNCLLETGVLLASLRMFISQVINMRDGCADPQPIAGLYNASIIVHEIWQCGLIQERILTMITIQVGGKRGIDREKPRMREHDDGHDAES